MKTIRNKTPMPIKVQLGGGKTLFLGPTKTGQISDSAAERDSVLKLIKDGKIEILGGESGGQTPGGGSQSRTTSTQGHQRSNAVTSKGDR
jgi:hypothetical protein